MLGHSAGMQLIGWTSMIVTRTAERGLVAAVQSTVSGDEPCALCKAAKIIAAKNQGSVEEGKQLPGPVGKSVKKPDFAHAELPVMPTLTTVVAELSVCKVHDFRALPLSAPEPPPPRSI